MSTPANGTPKNESPQTTAETMKKLDQTERTTGQSGAVPNTPKAMLLDATTAQGKSPNHRLRWVSIADASKVSGRIAEGYERVPDDEGGRSLGNLALFRIPKEQYDRKVQAIKDLNERRLHAHKAEVAQVAESIERTLRDKHGIRAKVMIEDR